MECQSEKIITAMSFLLLCLGFLAVPGKSLAASAVVEFSTDKTEVKKMRRLLSYAGLLRKTDLMMSK